MRQGVVALAIVAMMAGCDSSVDAPNPTPYETEPDRGTAQAIAQMAVREKLSLFDPGSAQFRNVKVDGRRSWLVGGENQVGWQISFELNAKNRLGGYVGFTRYLVLMRPDGMFAFRADPQTT